MDVQCERCKAEYEFDDALISGRGTTVKCTNCGHQFKVRKTSGTAEVSPDRWAVRTVEGRALVFTSLRELQKAIHARQVGRADTLTRGEGPPRALGTIAELEPFFDEASERGSGANPFPQADGKRPLMASAAVAQVPVRKSSRPPPPLGGRTVPTLRPLMSPTPPPAGVQQGPVPAMRPRIDTIRPPGNANAAVPPPLPSRPRQGSFSGLTDELPTGSTPAGPPVSIAPVLTAGDLIPESEEPTTTTMPRATAPPPAAHLTDLPIPLRPPPARTLPHAPAPPPPPPARMPPRASLPSVEPPSIDPPPPAFAPEPALPPPTVPVRMVEPRRALSSIEDDELEIAGKPRRLGGWIVALVLMAGAGVIGFAFAKPYLDARGAKTETASALDPRAAQMLSDGERALTAGDLEGANDAFTRASALAEKDPRVLLDVARLANTRADVPWLRARVLAADATDDERTTKAQLSELGARAKKAADDANAAAPEQPNAVLAKIDALRITGDSATARALVSKVIQGATQPETAYALAALDLAEQDPLWPMVIERLRLAAAGEGDAGRARAALVYALARSGDASSAKTELDKLAALARPYPLVGPLRTFVAKVPDAKDAGAASAKVGRPAAPAAGGAAGAGGGGGGGGHGGASYSGANDPRFLLAQAESAKNAGDSDRARALYSSALAQNANDSEALAGLGDLNHGAHDLAGAAGYYKRALSVNPVYLPALVGLGDVEWESGDKDEAERTYRDIIERFPEGTYPARIHKRANDAPAAPAAPARSAESAGTSP